MLVDLGENNQTEGWKMKTITTLGFLAALALLGCGGEGIESGSTDGAAGPGADAGSPGDGGTVGDGGTAVVTSNLSVQDATGQTLGWLLSANDASLMVLTPKGYITTISWDATPILYAVYYSDINCAGDAYLYIGEFAKMFGAIAYSLPLSRGLAVSASIANDGTAVSDGATVKTYLHSDGSCEDATHSFTGTPKCIKLKAITPAEAGILAVVNPPLKIVPK